MNPEFLEDDMADVIVAHSEELLGERLTLRERKFWIGRYELDLLFSDRHGGKLIVELQRGTLDRYHLYNVLDYYDEYKDRHPEEFVEVMVVANEISPERKQRLAKRGINYREIPEEVIRKRRQPETTPAQPTEGAQPPVPLDKALLMPEWLRVYLAQVNPWVRENAYEWLAHLEVMSEDERRFQFVLACAQYEAAILEQMKEGPPTAALTERFDSAPVHMSLLFVDALSKDALDAAIHQVPAELAPLLRLGQDRAEPAQFFTQRRALIGDLVQRTTEDPLFLLRLCGSLRQFWCENPVGSSFLEARSFLHLLHVCLADIVKWTSLRLFKTSAIPVGVDERNNFITRPVNLRSGPNIPDPFDHLAWALALPRNAIVSLWREGERLSGDVSEGGFPFVENAFEIGNDLLVNAYGGDFLIESAAQGLPPTPKRRRVGGDAWLYEVFRCGFVHGYPSADVSWGRNPRRKRYWLIRRGRLILNIDELVRGFQCGIEEFRRLVAVDAELRSRFTEYIVAD